MTNTIPDSILREVGHHLGRYVYALVDPRDGTPFYVGKGVGDRFSSHGREADLLTQVEDSGPADDDEGKVARIHAIRAAGLEPVIWILRHGMSTEAEYTAAEAVAIDTLMSFPVAPLPPGSPSRRPLTDGTLTNRRREQSRGHGARLLSDIVAEIAAPPLVTSTPLMTITLGAWEDEPAPLAGGRTRQGHGYKDAWLNPVERDEHVEQIAMSTAGWWKIDAGRPRRDGIQHVLAARHGVTRALLRIVEDSWESDTWTDEDGRSHTRRSFDYEVVSSGPLFDELVGPYGRRIPPKKKGEQGIIRYWPRGVSLSDHEGL